MSRLLQHLVDAASLSGLYAIYALGVALVFGIMRLINFAHASSILVAGYAAVLTSGLHLGLRVLVVVASAVVATLIFDWAAFSRVRDSAPTTLLVTSFAVFIVVGSLAEAVFGVLPRAALLSSALDGTWLVAGVQIQRMSVLTLAVTGLLLAAVWYLLNRTRVGVQMRGVAEDIVASRLMGIEVDRVIRMAFVAAGVLAAAAALLLVARTGSVTPAFGLNALLFGLVATVVGGLSDVRGAVLGGLLLGALAYAVQAFFPLEIRVFRSSIVFGIVFLLLAFRPEGLFVRTEARV